MFVKMLLAFVVSIGLAGGAVYYGMPTFDVDKSGLSAPKTSGEQNTQIAKPKNFLDKFVKKTPAPDPVKQVKPKQIVTTHTTTEIATTETASEPDGISNNNQAVLDQLMNQAARIQTPNLKDQAYLGITHFAVQFDNFDAANLAMAKIKQKELRDTARGNIAVFMARTGRVASAFKMIDDVEIESLRDVMRLQVIEAIVIPNQMPPAIQQ